ncbi:hypothetical protein Acr_08g0009010 [Actinidia rufa]|uniref:PRONE domain-containing protein n=1 Tax=Actinidia rufa TaxID=165716 RepID=A0A7J0F1D9_9ERIC|nr:hypothetical protein Acr_08g0009010 [Actinidia rufa]
MRVWDCQSAQVAYTGTSPESLLPTSYPQSMVPVKMSMKADSGLPDFQPNNNMPGQLLSLVGQDIPLQMHQHQLEIVHIVAQHLPLQNGKARLGDNIYCLITAEQFSTDCLLNCLDLSSEYHTLDVANRIEAAVKGLVADDDATKRCDTAESMSVFSRGGLGGLPVQKRISPSPFSVQHNPYTSPFAAPTFCSSPALVLSPGRAPQLSEKNGLKAHRCLKLGKQMPAELQKLWSYAGNLGSRRVYANSLEFD